MPKISTNLKWDNPLMLRLEEPIDQETLSEETLFVTAGGTQHKIPMKVKADSPRVLAIVPKNVIDEGKYELHLSKNLKTRSGRSIVGDLVLGLFVPVA